jgi:hypothetical protein
MRMRYGGLQVSRSFQGLVRRKWYWFALFGSVLLLGSYLLLNSYAMRRGSREPSPGAYDSTIRSVDFDRDRQLMWETTTEDGEVWSTDAAINAASRVFNCQEMILGRPATEVIRLLQPPSSGAEIHQSPFFLPKDPNGLTYRFDSGMYGWQFDHVVNQQGNVAEIRRRWIH